MPEVHIYHHAVGDQVDRDLARAWPCLDAGERERAGRFRFERDRTIYVLAHGLLRLVLQRYTGVAAGELRFATGPYGKPELLPAPALGRDIRFSLAHTSGRVGCGVAEGHDVGLDLEVIRAPAPMEVAQSFSPAERAWLQQRSEETRPDDFFTLWTLKEAYLKARGLGLSLPLDSFTMEVAPDGGAARVVVARPEQDPASWTFRCWRLPAHRMALAVRAPAERVAVVVEEVPTLERLAGDPTGT